MTQGAAEKIRTVVVLVASGLMSTVAFAAASIVDAVFPDPGTGFWYVVRGRNVCGTGTWGAGSDGAPRGSTACP
jgi:hypothetical protein